MKTPANLKKRLITGTIALVLFAGMLIVDRRVEPWIPCLFFCVVVLTVLAGIELGTLFAPNPPGVAFRIVFPLLLIVAFWDWHANHESLWNGDQQSQIRAWLYFAALFGMALFAAVLDEIMGYRPNTGNLRRLGLSFITLFYLGLLPCFLLELRWLYGGSVLAATILVPKLGDVGAYFTGSLLGRHRMTPILSPKKTWEGFAGGLVISILVAITIQFISPEPLIAHGVLPAVIFGLVIGLAGVLGDLFESLIKREADAKDASQTLPGFGGILDLVDSVLFAAPTAYFLLLFFRIMNEMPT